MTSTVAIAGPVLRSCAVISRRSGVTRTWRRTSVTRTVEERFAACAGAPVTRAQRRAAVAILAA